MKRITLCGIKHSGKTTVGKCLAARMHCPFTDTDDALCALYERETGKRLSVREIYRALGERAFRLLEIRALRQMLAGEAESVTALGGGTLSNEFLTPEDRKQMGFLCCLDLPDQTAWERIISEGLPPFLQSEKDPFAAFVSANAERRKLFFRSADRIFRTEGITPEKLAENILTATQENLP